MIPVIQVVAIFFIPLLIIRYHNFRLTRLIGTIGMAYLLGLIVAFIVYLVNLTPITITLDSEIGEVASFAAIGVAIPLLLFSANLQEAKKLSKVVLLSFASMVVIVMLVSAIAFFIYGRLMEDGAVISAMAVGVYTGGTPNLNAIANIFGLVREKIVVINLSEMIIGALFYVFLLLLCKPLLDKILKSSNQVSYLKESSNIHNVEDLGENHIRFSKKLILSIGLALLMAIVSAVVGVVVWVMLGSAEGRMNDYLVPALMIGVTVLGIAASFNKKIREVEGTNVAGQYLILVFSFALASSVDFSLIQGAFLKIFIFYGCITFVVFVLHTLVAKVLKINAECTMITLTAGLYGPAFIPAIVKQIKNDDLTVPGLICGSIGYAIGTFLGAALGLLLLLF